MNASDIVGPISARMDGHFAEDVLPPEVRYPKYGEYLRLRSAVARATKSSSSDEIHIAQAELEEFILSLCK